MAAITWLSPELWEQIKKSMEGGWLPICDGSEVTVGWQGCKSGRKMKRERKWYIGKCKDHLEHTMTNWNPHKNWNMCLSHHTDTDDMVTGRSWLSFCHRVVHTPAPGPGEAGRRGPAKATGALSSPAPYSDSATRRGTTRGTQHWPSEDCGCHFTSAAKFCTISFDGQPQTRIRHGKEFWETQFHRQWHDINPIQGWKSFLRLLGISRNSFPGINFLLSVTFSPLTFIYIWRQLSCLIMIIITAHPYHTFMIWQILAKYFASLVHLILTIILWGRSYYVSILQMRRWKPGERLHRFPHLYRA